MIFSANQLLSDGQNVTADAASTNVIDLGAAGTPYGAAAALDRDVGKGNPVHILVNNDADSSGTSQTCAVVIQVDTVENFASPTELARVNLGASVQGDQIGIQVLPTGANQRYLRLYYDVGGTTPDYTFTAGITMGNQTNS